MLLLLKYRHGDNVTMQHVNRLLSDVSVLQEVNGLRELMTELGRHMERAESTGDERRLCGYVICMAAYDYSSVD